jgi:hypothetical protein
MFDSLSATNSSEPERASPDGCANAAREAHVKGE